ncbi:hypothetical protein [Enterovirga rhinocerotis]|uniref:Uncharacterized protein n=1 Tax=Enterovirga rhinocerotis TaxID=1339210 RepID=A0A4R7C4D7_9HYPH|nr:hypothetical protein [Enterovirga rhinocerotis]TDR93011.1 hypothetical protein EV668_0258 [Enterovirga rhinocerotis]
MAISRRAQDRLLSQDELDLVQRTRDQALRDAGHSELTSLRAVIRERRDRARATASRQRREMRGKAEPKGARPAAGNVGTVGKYDLLTSALKRIGNELRRRTQSSKATQSRHAQRALSMKNAAPSTSTKPDDRTADEGMRSVPNDAQAPSGAFGDAGLQPAMQRAKFAR